MLSVKNNDEMKYIIMKSIIVLELIRALKI